MTRKAHRWAAFTFMTLAVTFACIQPAEAQAKDFNVPAQSATTGIPEFARQAGIQILVSEPLVRGKRIAAVTGSHSVEEALAILLKGTGLVATSTDGATYTVATVPAPSSLRNSTAPAAALAASQSASENPANTRVPVSESREGEKPKLEEIIVTGSRIPSVAGEQAQPVRSYSRADIERSGQTTVADFLNTLPDVSTMSGESGLQQFLGQTTVQLHGLPVGTTLVLLNGRRVETGFYGFFDLSSLPLSAVERIDVLPVGASAIYGSNALAGAVNIVLRGNLDGFEANAKVGRAIGTGETDLDAGWGKALERGSVSLIANYQQRDELMMSDRSWASVGNFPANAPSFYFADNCSPGNVYSLTGKNLPGLSAPEAGVPAGFVGTATAQTFAQTAGKINHCDYLQQYSLIPPTTREGALLSARLAAGDTAELFTEVLYSHQQRDIADGAGINLYGGSFGAYTLGVANPYNPFGQAVGISYSDPSTVAEYKTSESLIRPLLGVRGNLGSEWKYEVTTFYSRDNTQASLGGVPDPTALQNALDSANAATAFNPLTTGPPGTPTFLQSLIASGSHYPYDFTNDILEAQGVVRGPVVSLPGGQLQSVFGAEGGRERQESLISLGAPSLHLERRTYALFTEEKVPVLAPRRQTEPPVLELTGAGRYDHSSDFGGKATWQGALLWHPAASLLIRGGLGASYEAPQLQQLGGGTQASYPLGGLVDPFRGGQTVTVPVVQASNPNLKPETGQSRMAGIVYKSGAISGFEISADYFAVNINNFIGVPAVQTLIDDPTLFPGAVLRSPPTAADIAQGFLGPITQVNDLYFNFGELRVAGVDLDMRYEVDTRIGRIAETLAVGNIYKWDSALTPNTPAISYVSQATLVGPGFAPRWKGSLTTAWTLGPASASVTARYVGPYKDYQDYVPNNSELGNFWLFDVASRWNLGDAFASRRWIHGTYLGLGAVNIFDRRPPFSYGGTPADLAEYDVRGRFVYLEVGGKW